jgi:hypothetical protein
MNTPGFTGQTSLYKTRNSYRAANIQPALGVYPALPAGGMRPGCALCISICSIFDGEFECGLRCTAIGLCRPVILEG